VTNRPARHPGAVPVCLRLSGSDRSLWELCRGREHELHRCRRTRVHWTRPSALHITTQTEQRYDTIRYDRGVSRGLKSWLHQSNRRTYSQTQHITTPSIHTVCTHCLYNLLLASRLATLRAV